MGKIVAVVVLVFAATEVYPQVRRLEVAKGFMVPYPANWAPGPTRYRNAHELLTPTAAATGTAGAAARILITTERRGNHAEAVARLSEIAAEVSGSPPRFVRIQGWPALQRRYRAPIAQRGQNQIRPGGVGEILTDRVTTAIAAADLLVRLEATLSPGADASLAKQAESIGTGVNITPQGNPAQTDQQLQKLRASPPAAVAPPVVRGPAVTAPAVTGPTVTGPVVPAPLLTGRLPASLIVEPSPLRSEVAGEAMQVQGGVGELEITASNDGQNVVIAANSGISVSNDGGSNFNGVAAGANFPVNGDLTAATGASGNFYLGYIAFPNGTPAANNVNGCSTGVSVSTNNGAAFAFRNHAVLCPQAGAGVCFPDQPHIAADRANAAAGGGDQVYSVWRNFTPAVAPNAPMPQCNAIGSGFVTPSLVCSTDGGNNWTVPVAVDNGDFPRVTAGQDGFVYVAYRNNGNLMVNRYSSCANGLVQQAGFPVTVAMVSDVACPVPGLDRCNDGNTLSSQMVAVDDTNPNHVYVAYANRARTGNENILVRQSNDGGRRWSEPVVVNSPDQGRRFMPWVCSVGGAAYVTWYDRRRASVSNADDLCQGKCEEGFDDCVEGARGDLDGLRRCNRAFRKCRAACEKSSPPSNNDLTEYFLGTALVENGVLRAGPEINLSGRPDPQCASGWPCQSRSRGDSESCTVQPQPAGICCNANMPGCPGSRQPCDFSAGGCPAGETCNGGGGCPKYGDYNGNACAGGRIFTAWASATAPAGLAPVGGITVFSSTVNAPTLTVRKTVIPAQDPGQFNIVIDGITRASDLKGGGSTQPLAVSPGMHRVSETDGTNTRVALYTRTFGGDCGSGGIVSVGLGETRTCTITNTRVPAGGRAECINTCEERRRLCLQLVAEESEPGGPTANDCGRAFERCRGGCPVR